MKLRRGASPRISTVEQVQAWMRANRSALERVPGAQGQDDGEQPVLAISSGPDEHGTPAAAPADPLRSDDARCPFHLFHRASQRRLGSPARTSF